MFCVNIVSIDTAKYLRILLTFGRVKVYETQNPLVNELECMSGNAMIMSILVSGKFVTRRFLGKVY